MWIIDHMTGEPIREMTDAEVLIYEAEVEKLSGYEKQVGAVEADIFGLSPADHPAGVFCE